VYGLKMNINAFEVYADDIEKIMRSLDDDIELDLPEDSEGVMPLSRFQQNDAMMTRLIEDVQRGNTWSLIRSFHKMSTEEKTSHEWSLFTLAASMGRIEVMRLLLRNGQDINAMNTYGSTALHVAAGFNRGKAIDFLLENGADINKMDEIGRDAMQYAIRGPRCMRAINRLLKAGAVISGNSIQSPSPLMQSCSMPCHETTLLLLARGADVHARNWGEQTPLWPVCESYTRDTAEAFLETASVLVTFGVDVNAIDINGDHVIHALIRNKETSEGDVVNMLQMFLDLRPDTNLSCKDHAGRTPLHLTAKIDMWENELYMEVEIFTWLVAHGADVSATDAEGNTPLHLLVVSNSLALTRELLETLHARGVSSSSRNHAGHTAEEIAATHGYVGMVDLIHSYSDEFAVKRWGENTGWGLQNQHAGSTHLRRRRGKKF
jgi:ankyrin repeat protein